MVETKSIRILIGGIFYHHAVGSLYLWGAISIYIAAYFKEIGFDYSAGFYLFYVPLRGLINMISVSCGTAIENNYGPKAYYS